MTTQSSAASGHNLDGVTMDRQILRKSYACFLVVGVKISHSGTLLFPEQLQAPAHCLGGISLLRGAQSFQPLRFLADLFGVGRIRPGRQKAPVELRGLGVLV